MMSILGSLLHYLCLVVFFVILIIVGIVLGKKYRMYKDANKEVEKRLDK